MINPNSEMVGPLTDYVISCFRRELGLWYDTNDHPRSPKCLNDAFLMDGSSFVSLGFTLHFFPGSFTITSAEGVAVFASALLREDSRMELENQEDVFRTVSQNATVTFEGLPDTIKGAPHVALLSFEIRQSSTANRTQEWLNAIASRIGGTVERWPGYSGRLSDDPMFHLVEEPETDWVQVTLNERLSEREVANALTPYLANAAEFRSGTNKWYSATAELKDAFGINSMLILARQF